MSLRNSRANYWLGRMSLKTGREIILDNFWIVKVIGDVESKGSGKMNEKTDWREVMGALKKIKSGKLSGLDFITLKILKYGGYSKRK